MGKALSVVALLLGLMVVSRRHRPPAERRVSPPVGISLVWEIATSKLETQLCNVDALDTKAGVFVAGLGIALGALVQADASKRELAIGGFLLAVAFACAVRGFLVGHYTDAPTPRTVTEYARSAPDEIRELFLASVLEAHDRTSAKVLAKGRWINRSAFISGLTVVVLVVGKVMGV